MSPAPAPRPVLRREAVAFSARPGNPHDAIARGVQGVPETFLMRADGLVLPRHVGALDTASHDGLVVAVEDAQGRQ